MLVRRVSVNAQYLDCVISSLIVASLGHVLMRATHASTPTSITATLASVLEYPDPANSLIGRSNASIVMILH